MKNQKVLMSLLTASISALAAAPALAGEKNDQIISIDINKIVKNSEKLSESDIVFKNKIKTQVESMLSKKSPILQINESINIVVDNYTQNDTLIKQKVLKELNLGAGGTQDSTGLVGVENGQPTGSVQLACHATCHTACHGACHGARGWR